MWRGLLAWVFLLSDVPRLAVTVDTSKFRTCQQGSFCRRYRSYAERVRDSGGADFAHELDRTSVEHRGHAISAKLRFVHGGDAVKPLKLDLKFFKDDVEENCGIVRLTVNEEAPLHPRFQLKEGDVVMEEGKILPDEVTVSEEEGLTRFVSKSPGACQVVLRHKPFELEFFGSSGKVLQRLNARHLLNFETYRPKAGMITSGGLPTHSGLMDATDVDSGELWEESFAGHHDSKPRGPASVGIDVTFEQAPMVVGLAEHASKLDLGDTKFSEPYRLYNLDVFEYALDVPMALYGAIPLVTAVHHWTDHSPATASGFFFVNPSEGFVKVDPPNAAGSTESWWLFESGVLDVFLFAGPTAHAVLQQYHTVTGMPRLPPLFALGKHQCRWNYVDVEDSIGVNKKFDQHDIPYDVLWLDIEHTDGKKYFTWHPSHFAEPEKLLDALAQDKRKLVTIVDPHIKRDTGYNVFTKMRDLDMYTKTKSGQQYDGWCWPGTSFYPDFCDSAVRDQWAKFFKPDFYPHSRDDLFTWNDMNEPSVFNGPEVTMPRDNLHKCHTGSFGVEHRDVHNVYGFYHHAATVQGQLERAPNIRPFVLTRSFFAGSHRHSAMWTGDNMAKWDHLARSIPMLLSLSLCGYSFAGADVPGFFYNPDVELFTRWHQLGIWYPFYRGHAHLETKRREPWLMGDETTILVRDAISARYQLMPTWYTLYAEWAMRGLPIIRPLWYHDLEEVAASRDHVDEAFLVGEAILVRAVAQAGLRSVPVYFPKGTWYDYWSNQAAPHSGGSTATIDLQNTHVPVFVKKGHILFKRMRRRRSTGAMVADPYTVIVYGGAAGAPARGRLYIDDGETHNYERGAFIYEEFEFDGGSMTARAAPEVLGQKRASRTSLGLPDVPKRRLRVERCVFVALQQQPVSARLVHGGGQNEDLLEVSSEKAADGTWIATVKKPTLLIGAHDWSLKLSY